MCNKKDLKVNTLTLELALWQNISQALHKSNIFPVNSKVIIDELKDYVCITFSALFAGKKIKTIKDVIEKVPISWWQYFKLCYFPKWLKKIFPIKYRSIIAMTDIYHICPHINVPWKENDIIHISFLKSSKS